MIHTVTRDVPGHFCAADYCHFFLHTDVVDDTIPAEDQTRFCVSAIGEYYPPGSNTAQRVNLDSYYEIMVFDKLAQPWGEIEGLRLDDKAEVVRKFQELVEKYRLMAKEE